MRLQQALLAASTWPRPSELCIPPAACPIPLEFSATFKSHQRIFELLDVGLTPEHHVPDDNRLGKPRDPAPSCAPKRDDAHTQIVRNHLLRNEVTRKLHQTLAAPVELAFTNPHRVVRTQ